MIIFVVLFGLISCNVTDTESNTATDRDTSTDIDSSVETFEQIEINSIEDFLSCDDLRIHVSFQPRGWGYILNLIGNKLYYVTTDVNDPEYFGELVEQHTLSEDEIKTLKEYCDYLRGGYDLKEVIGTDGIQINIWLDSKCILLSFGDQNDTIDEMVLFLIKFLPKEVSHIDELTNIKRLNQQ